MPATKGDLLRVQSELNGKIKDLQIEIAKVRVSMAWMTVAVIAGLGGLITLFEFMS